MFVHTYIQAHNYIHACSVTSHFILDEERFPDERGQIKKRKDTMTMMRMREDPHPNLIERNRRRGKMITISRSLRILLQVSPVIYI